MTVLSIDPGRSAKPSIGWCLFEKDGTEIARGEMDWKGLVQSFDYLVYYLGGDLTFKDAGYTQTLKHLPHADAAYVHGYSDFVERGIRPALGVGATL
jgi:hypothetical protein